MPPYLPPRREITKIPRRSLLRAPFYPGKTPVTREPEAAVKARHPIERFSFCALLRSHFACYPEGVLSRQLLSG